MKGLFFLDIFKKCYDFTAVRDAKEAGIYPYFHALESRQDVEVIMEGKRRIMLGSNNYLGLTVNEDIINAGIETLRQYGRPVLQSPWHAAGIASPLSSA